MTPLAAMRPLFAALVLLALVPWRSSDAGEERVPARFPGGDGRVRILVRPEFRDAAALREDLGGMGVEGLEVALAGPLVPAPDPKLPPQPSRLLLSGSPLAIARGREALALLDVPRPSAVVSVLVCEVRQAARRQRGGHVLFDRDQGPEAPRTLLRGVVSSFEPEAWLRSAVTGARPFQGTSVVFGHGSRDLLREGAFEVVLRMLAERGEAEFVAWPTLRCTEGEAARLVSLAVVPQVVLQVTNAEATARQVPAPVLAPDLGVALREEVGQGIVLSVLPVRISSDGVVLDLGVDLRLAEAAPGSDNDAGNLVFRRRQVLTRVTAPDGLALLVGGIRLRRHLDDRTGLPVLSDLPAVGALTSARGSRVEESELVLLVRARVLTPGRGAPRGGQPKPEPAQR